MILENLNPPLLYRGSVKDILGPLQIEKKDVVIFDFSNRYSVFDWGEMPDELTFKGASLANIAYLFFKYLEDSKFWKQEKSALEKNILDAPNFLKEQSKLELEKFIERGAEHHLIQFLPPKSFSAKALKIIRPKLQESYDYSEYLKKPTGALVPLEIVFRFGLTDHSSILKRATPEYLESLGLDCTFLKGNEKFSFPLIEFFTKLENTDRPLSYLEAQEVAGLSPSEFKSLLAKNAIMALMLKNLFKKCDVELVDGKLEWGFGEQIKNFEREFILADSIGPDELRLNFKGVELSKEVLRVKYRQGEWFKNTERAKSLAKERTTVDWKKICKEEFNSYPEKLPESFLNGVSMIYRSIAVALWPWVFSGENNQSLGLVHSLDDLANFLKSESGGRQ